ncbi:MAG: hypothetical protein K1X71_02150 [Pirellulales bacterium]|nr:hypothetical protein [Pirellulales bacterium]
MGAVRIAQFHFAPQAKSAALLARAMAVALTLAVLTGCGTTRWSDTQRTATEQLLLSNAIDKAVSEFNFGILAGREVYFDASYLKGVTDENYIVSSIRQHLLASGCVLREAKDKAEFIVEARSGGVGTDRSDLLFGLPAVAVPSVPGVPLPSAIPELPLAKATNQKAVAKLAVFAYSRETGRPVMQTGIDPVTSTARNSWFFGAGPFQRGTVYEGTKFAGDQFEIPIIGGRNDEPHQMPSIPVTAAVAFPQNLQTGPGGQQLVTPGQPAPPAVESASDRVARLPRPAAALPANPSAPVIPSAANGAPPPGAPAPRPTPVQAAQYLAPADNDVQGTSSGMPDKRSARLDFSGWGNFLKREK